MLKPDLLQHALKRLVDDPVKLLMVNTSAGSSDEIRTERAHAGPVYRNGGGVYFQVLEPDLFNMSDISEPIDAKPRRPDNVFRASDRESQRLDLESPSTVKSLGAGSALAIGVFGVTLTTLSFSLMEWRGVTIVNVYVADFFFAAALGLLITAQWEMSLGNGFSYTVFSAFGLFYAGYAAILTPAFGIAAAYGDDTAQYNNALGFFMIMWTIFVLSFFVASLPTNLVYILIFGLVDLGFVTVAASYFAAADGHPSASVGLKKAGGVFCFLAGLVGWYLTFQILLKDTLIQLPLGDTSRYFRKGKT